jgi:general secretion pathway protein G
MKLSQAQNSLKLTHQARGFSLLEMMMVVLIIGLLATVLITSLSGTPDRVKARTSMTLLAQVKSALTEYNGNFSGFPTNDLGLVVLVPKYLEKPATDGWGRQLRYVYPSINQSANAERPFDLISAGKDGEFGTADDIDVWTMDVKTVGN